MGTNYYRIPSVEDINKRHQKFNIRMSEMDIWSPSLIEREYSFIDDEHDPYCTISPWDEFINGIRVHLGKRSSGWKFCWNFHDGKYYNTKDELLNFIRSGRVVNEYGDAIPVEEFIEMALNWGEPDGLIADQEYFTKNKSSYQYIDTSNYYDKIIDGLRVSSSTDFS